MKTARLCRLAIASSLAASVCLPADRIVVDCSRTLYRTDPLFFGINTLFWIDDDASRADGAYRQSVAALGAKLLRYPGGMGGNNFHWRENRLHDIDRFPYEDGPEKMDFDEFIELCRQTGAEPIVVVNAESWIMDGGDIADGAAEAADWVRYCKEKGYRVHYWEIGNEVYHHVRLGAEDYARLILRYAEAMKAADPAIRIGAVGHWDYLDVGAGDRCSPEDRAALIEAERAVAGKEATAAFKQFSKSRIEQDRRKGEPRWWPTVFEIAGAEIDFAVVHWYFGASLVPQLDSAIRDLKAFLDEKAGRPVPLAMTEWNVGSEMQKSMTRFEHDLIIAEAAARFLDGGIAMGAYWPARIRAGNYTLIDYNDNSLTDSGKLFAALSAATLERRVAAQGPEGAYVFATAGETSETLRVWIVNRSDRAFPDATLAIDGAAIAALQAQTYVEGQMEPAPAPLPAASAAGTFAISIPPRSCTIVSGATRPGF
ncbi:MAG: Intracellular exo-alpha-(1-_5)-L-arabinofuranosidase [candidate division BRC1 bacterium ADurb.BinA364]|nr:MAG: Intracellular exo-alpha-(1->5)-L-arabinofuranosidase [candidate division BRC1 bacterium ADurb.BinA364]